MTEDLYNLINDRGYTCDFADNFIWNAKQVSQSGDFWAAKRVTEDLLFRNRSDYATASQYVEAMRAAHSKCNRRIKITPFAVAIMLLRNIHSDSPNWIENKCAQYQKEVTDANKFTADHLITLFNELIDHLQIHEANP
jgi:hypothetical protein